MAIDEIMERVKGANMVGTVPLPLLMSVIRCRSGATAHSLYACVCVQMFVTAGMGGGTGTGAAPVIAQAAVEAGILTVAVVTKVRRHPSFVVCLVCGTSHERLTCAWCRLLQPFRFEGTNRSKLAEYGLSELKQSVDTMIVIPNQNLFNMSNERTSLMDAFRCV